MTIGVKKSLSRRTILRGAGAALALPFLDAMAPAYTTLAPAVRRLGFVYVPNGIIMDQWIPSGEGADFQLSPTMMALEPFRKKLNILTGLAQLNGRALGDGPGDHARAGASWLTGAHPKRTEGVGIKAGISADQIAANAFSGKTQLASLELALEVPTLAGGCENGYSCAYTNTLSWRTPQTPLPTEVNPRAVFERLFGDGETTDAAGRAAGRERRKSILDYIHGSVKKLEPDLGGADRGKLSEYLDAVRDVEKRIQQAESKADAVAVPSFDRPAGVPSSFEDHANLMLDLYALAFQTDITRVITLMTGRETSNRAYPQIGVPDGHHSVTHHSNDAAKIAKTQKIDAYMVGFLARLLSRLDSTRDGDGTLLDHSMILYGSSLSDGNRHQHDNLPLVLAGSASGRLKTGRHMKFPDGTPMNNLLLSMLDRMDVPNEAFGDSTGKLEI